MGLIQSNVNKHWPGNCVVYAYDEDLSNDERGVLAEAMQVWEATGHVRFVERTTQDRYVKYIPDFIPYDGTCSSDAIGMSGGQQTVRIDPRTPVGVVAHEIGHVLGFFHEQSRPDRDRFVEYHPENLIEWFYGHNFRIVGDDTSDMVGSYDFDSIMHYGGSTFAKSPKKPTITTDDPANQERIGQLTNLSPGDVATAHALNRGTMQVYQLSHHGQVEGVAQLGDLSRRWSLARPYAAGAGTYLFFLHSPNGHVQTRSINFDGSIGAAKITRNWEDDWTQAVTYDVFGVDYLMLYMATNGAVHTKVLHGDGTVGGGVHRIGTIEKGFTGMCHYRIGVNNFMLFYNRSSGFLRVYEIHGNGSLGQPRYSEEASSGFSDVSVYSVSGGTFLYRLNTRSGRVVIRRLLGNGDVKETVDTADWSSGWTSSIPYQIGPSTFLLSVKVATGDLSIRRLEGDGTLGKQTDRRVCKPGFDIAAIYSAGVGTYVALING